MLALLHSTKAVLASLSSVTKNSVKTAVTFDTHLLTITGVPCVSNILGKQGVKIAVSF